MLTIEQLVPQDHLLRKLDAAIDFSFIYPLVEDLYSLFGRPSIDPVVLIKMKFIEYTFDIRSTTLRVFKKMSMQAMLTFVAQNPKKLASWIWIPYVREDVNTYGMSSCATSS